MPKKSKQVGRARIASAAVALVALGCAVPAVVRAAGTDDTGTVPAVDGGYVIGDAADDRPVAWVSTDAVAAHQRPSLIAVSIAGRVVGFVRSDDLFAAGPPPDQRREVYSPTIVIVDEQGRRLGQFVDGLPVLDSNG